MIIIIIIIAHSQLGPNSARVKGVRALWWRTNRWTCDCDPLPRRQESSGLAGLAFDGKTWNDLRKSGVSVVGPGPKREGAESEPEAGWSSSVCGISCGLALVDMRGTRLCKQAWLQRIWLRRNGVNTNGAAAKLMTFYRLGKQVHPGTFGRQK